MCAQQGKCEVRVHRGQEPAVMQNAGPWAQRFVDYARLSALVYRYVQDKENEDALKAAGWTQSPDSLDVMDDAKTSLYFEVWEKLAANPVEVAVAFRGTHEWKDWWSNAHWITRFIPIGWDQYTLVRHEIFNVVTRAKQRRPGASIRTTGHSLGGGLAQQAAYAHPEIKLVVAFDSSPVTGFQSVSQPARDENRQGIEIFRVYEYGEILAYFRTFLRGSLPLSLANPSLTEARFNLRQGEPVQLHSMVDLAKDMGWAADNCKVVA